MNSHRIDTTGKIVLAALALFSLLFATSALAGEEDEALVTCTVRIEYQDMLAESFADGLTIEEAEDHALEGACALRCVTKADEANEPTEGTPTLDKQGTEAPVAPKEEGEAKAKSGAAPPLPEGEVLAEDDPDGVEACIESCAEDAILIGTHCTDAASETVFAEGAFDPDDSGETKSAGAGYGDAPNEKETKPTKGDEKAPAITPPAASK